MPCSRHCARRSARFRGSRLIALGTRPADPTHWFAKLLSGGADYAQCHAAADNDPPFRRRTWDKANPSLRHLPSLLDRIKREAADAKIDESMLASFKALRLNQGTADVTIRLLLAAETWERIEGRAERRGDYVLGVDMGGSAAMSAASAYWPATGLLECFACFAAMPGLAERGLRDGVGRLYTSMAKRGELIQSDGRVADPVVMLDEVVRRWGFPDAIACDRWRVDELRDALDIARFPLVPLFKRGMGFLDGAADVRSFRRACLRSQVTPAQSLLLRSAMREARTIADPAGNEKLSQGTEGGRRKRARDDAVAASVLAVSIGTRKAPDESARQGAYLGAV